MNRNSYIKDLRFRTRDTLFATFDQDFIVLQSLPSFSLTVFRSLARECNLDTIFFLETNNIFTALTDERRVILGRNFEDFRGLIRLKQAIRYFPLPRKQVYSQAYLLVLKHASWLLRRFFTASDLEIVNKSGKENTEKDFKC